jgi:hypothetical protein
MPGPTSVRGFPAAAAARGDGSETGDSANGQITLDS